jgi:hypothetical protein
LIVIDGGVCAATLSADPSRSAMTIVASPIADAGVCTERGSMVSPNRFLQVARS